MSPSLKDWKVPKNTLKNEKVMVDLVNITEVHLMDFQTTIKNCYFIIAKRPIIWRPIWIKFKKKNAYIIVITKVVRWNALLGTSHLWYYWIILDFAWNQWNAIMPILQNYVFLQVMTNCVRIFAFLQFLESQVF